MCIEKCCLKLSIQDHPQYVNFYVANKHQAMVDVVLDRPWLRHSNYKLDWKTR